MPEKHRGEFAQTREDLSRFDLPKREHGVPQALYRQFFVVGPRRAISLPLGGSERTLHDATWRFQRSARANLFSNPRETRARENAAAGVRFVLADPSAPTSNPHGNDGSRRTRGISAYFEGGPATINVLRALAFGTHAGIEY